MLSTLEYFLLYSAFDLPGTVPPLHIGELWSVGRVPGSSERSIKLWRNLTDPFLVV